MGLATVGTVATLCLRIEGNQQLLVPDRKSSDTDQPGQFYSEEPENRDLYHTETCSPLQGISTGGATRSWGGGGWATGPLDGPVQVSLSGMSRAENGCGGASAPHPAHTPHPKLPEGRH